MKKISNDRGFGPIEIVLIVVIVLAVGFIGYYIYHSNKVVNNTYSSSKAISNSPAPKFSKIKSTTGVTK